MRYRTNYELLFLFQTVCEKIHDGMYDTHFNFVGSHRYNQLFYLRNAYREIICKRMNS